jgi:hypothetical protein
MNITQNDRNQVFSSSVQNSLDIETDFALILTATINVDNLPRAFPSDKGVREAQYIETLTYYLHHHPQVKKIIFIENSASSLENLQQASQNNPDQKQVEFISLDTNLSYGNKGKGFGECLLIQEGLKQSELIKTVNYFAKITGRIRLVNLSNILATLPHDFDCVCDYKDQGYKIKNLLLKTNNAPFCDTRFIVFNKNFYQENLETLHRDFAQRFPKKYFCIEVEYYQKIQSLETQNKIIKRFKIEPKFSGISGHSGGVKYGGKDYNSFRENFKYLARVICRKIIPWLHI